MQINYNARLPSTDGQWQRALQVLILSGVERAMITGREDELIGRAKKRRLVTRGYHDGRWGNLFEGAPTETDCLNQCRDSLAGMWEEDLQADDLFLCQACGKIFSRREQYSDLYPGYCVTCSLWEDEVKIADQVEAGQRPLSDSIRINGLLYNFEPGIKKNGSRQDAQRLGYGGRVFKIKHHNGQEWITNDLFFAGHVLGIYRKRLPDNAEFVNEKVTATA